MFGQYGKSFTLSHDFFSIQINKKGDLYKYNRVLRGQEESKSIAARDYSIWINPIEPFQTPREIARNLLISLEPNVLLPPKESRRAYITFPVEIGVILVHGSTGEKLLIDAFTLSKSKFTLYGDITDGVLCKYWKSPVHTEPPKDASLYSGYMSVDITNRTNHWVEVKHIVFNAVNMKIFYDDTRVCMSAHMNIIGDMIAETGFSNTPPEMGLKLAFESFASRSLQVVPGDFQMQWGM